MDNMLSSFSGGASNQVIENFRLRLEEIKCIEDPSQRMHRIEVIFEYLIQFPDFIPISLRDRIFEELAKFAEENAEIISDRLRTIMRKIKASEI